MSFLEMMVTVSSAEFITWEDELPFLSMAYYFIISYLASFAYESRD